MSGVPQVVIAGRGCNYCSKPSASLKECKACHAARYCSKECQRADWKTHKPSCAVTTETRSSGRELLPKNDRINQSLTKWIAKQRGMLAQCASFALDLCNNPLDILSTHIVCVTVERQKSATDPAFYFRVTDGSVKVKRTHLAALRASYGGPPPTPYDDIIYESRDNTTGHIMITCPEIGHVRTSFFKVTDMGLAVLKSVGAQKSAELATQWERMLIDSTRSR